MSPIEKEAATDVFKALSEEEVKLALSTMPTSYLINELTRRVNQMENSLYYINSTLGKVDPINLVNHDAVDGVSAADDEPKPTIDLKEIQIPCLH